jgi:hypothetical protein
MKRVDKGWAPVLAKRLLLKIRGAFIERVWRLGTDLSEMKQSRIRGVLMERVDKCWVPVLAKRSVPERAI